MDANKSLQRNVSVVLRKRKSLVLFFPLLLLIIVSHAHFLFVQHQGKSPISSTYLLGIGLALP